MLLLRRYRMIAAHKWLVHGGRASNVALFFFSPDADDAMKGTAEITLAFHFIIPFQKSCSQAAVPYGIVKLLLLVSITSILSVLTLR